MCLPQDVESLFDNIASDDKKLVRFDSKHIQAYVDYPAEYEDAVMSFIE